MTLTSEMATPQTNDDKKEDYQRNWLALSQLLGGVAKSSGLLGAQIKLMITDVTPTEQISILKTARREFEKLSDKIGEALSQPMTIKEQVVADFIFMAQSIHKKELEDPIKQHAQLRSLSNTVKFLIYKAANMVFCSCFFTTHQRRKKSRVIDVLVKDTKTALDVEQSSNQSTDEKASLS